MTAPVDRYLKAARRESTQRRYRRALEHFEGTWGGLLHVSAESVARYLAEHAEQLASATVRTHLAALAQWHLRHGFVDPDQSDEGA